jgi:hypothetical protein
MERVGLILIAMVALAPCPGRPADPSTTMSEDVRPWAAPATTPPPLASDETPPMPPTNLPAPPPQAASGQTEAPSGQWVNTQQYGTVWMPYGDAYSYVPPNGEGQPYEYVYGASNGWTWVIAPWIWGIGPWPLFGVVGPSHFGWYGQGWWRTPERWHFGPGLHGSLASQGPGPARVQGGLAARRSAVRGLGTIGHGFVRNSRGDGHLRGSGHSGGGDRGGAHR